MGELRMEREGSGKLGSLSRPLPPLRLWNATTLGAQDLQGRGLGAAVYSSDHFTAWVLVDSAFQLQVTDPGLGESEEQALAQCRYRDHPET